MTRPNKEESILRQLDDAIRQPRAAKLLAAVANKVDESLELDANTHLAWKSVPLSVYNDLPAGIASSWIFALRADCSSGAERHPNSVQRFMSYRGSADMQTWNGAAWVSHVLRSEPDAPLDQRWLSIPMNTWHKPVMGDGNWVVVSFHTAADDELIEERPADDAHPEIRCDDVRAVRWPSRALEREPERPEPAVRHVPYGVEAIGRRL